MDLYAIEMSTLLQKLELESNACDKMLKEKRLRKLSCLLVAEPHTASKKILSLNFHPRLVNFSNVIFNPAEHGMLEKVLRHASPPINMKQAADNLVADLHLAIKEPNRMVTEQIRNILTLPSLYKTTECTTTTRELNTTASLSSKLIKATPQSQ